MMVRRAGGSGLLIECRDGDEAEAWRRHLWERRERGELRAEEIVPGARTVLLDGVAPGTRELVASWPAPDVTSGGEAGPLVEIPVVFDGDDLEAVAGRWEITVDAAVARMAATAFTVAFCGFAPGFAYLRGMRAEWAVPRLDTPRPRVPAGAVGLAGNWAGIYPAASPGGWQLVGRTAERLFDVRREPPALLEPGTRVRLTVVA